LKYHSTRGQAPHLGFDDALLTGLANDGGLYLPMEWPFVSEDSWLSMQGLSYSELAARVVKPFVKGSLVEDDLDQIISDTYNKFNHPDVAPMMNLQSNIWIMELYHGPTLAFKDFALQVIGNIFENILDKKGKKITIIGATSGDTGSAAISSCANRNGMNIFILHPKGRVSEVQRRQMTTVNAKNVFNIAVEGTFDDCQSLVKLMFKDNNFRDKLHLSAVNSINWARILFQMVYYVFATLSLGSINKGVSFAVPTGNFGNVFAGYCAKLIGLPINNFFIGSNNNDILTRFFTNGAMETKSVIPTISPAMDIQVSSNFERLLFESYKCDADRVQELMYLFVEKGVYKVEADVFKKIQSDFMAFKFNDDQTRSIMKNTFLESGYILDPHSAIGLGAAQSYRKDLSNPCVVLSTAHPSKFPDAVEAAIGIKPSLPKHMDGLYNLNEEYSVLPNDLDLIKDYISSNAVV